MRRISDTISDTGHPWGALIFALAMGCGAPLRPGFTDASARSGPIASADVAEGENQYEMYCQPALAH